MLASLNRLEELAGHVRGAVNNGVTKAEIQECLLQVAVYCAGMSGFKVARKVLDELGPDSLHPMTGQPATETHRKGAVAD